MAHFETTIETRAALPTAFDYVADFSNTRFWDPSVQSARRLDEGEIGKGSRFDVELSTPGRPFRFRYEIVRFEPNTMLVLCSESDRLRSLDTIEFEASPGGCRVHYDADLRLAGPLYLIDPLVHLGFQFSGARSAKGLERALSDLG